MIASPPPRPCHGRHSAPAQQPQPPPTSQRRPACTRPAPAPAPLRAPHKCATQQPPRPRRARLYVLYDAYAYVICDMMHMHMCVRQLARCSSLATAGTLRVRGYHPPRLLQPEHAPEAATLALGRGGHPMCSG